MAWFSGLSAVFAVLYLIPWWANCDPWIEELTAVWDASAGRTVSLHPATVVVRALYFSVVTMTTLGFGDLHAAPQSIAGHGLLTFQVLLGYVILGALVTRFSILFQSLGEEQIDPDDSGERFGRPLRKSNRMVDR
jgi:hypothetical protein